jgi:hypothetical protein
MQSRRGNSYLGFPQRNSRWRHPCDELAADRRPHLDCLDPPRQGRVVLGRTAGGPQESTLFPPAGGGIAATASESAAGSAR